MITPAQRFLREAFARLNQTQQRRLRAHAKRKTKVLCGKDHLRYTDGRGGG